MSSTARDGARRLALLIVFALAQLACAAPAPAASFLNYVGCLGPARAGCAQDGEGLSPNAVVSPPGSDYAYIVQERIGYGLIVQARRGPAGELIPVSCVSNAVGDGCTHPAEPAQLDNAAALIVGPDGRDAYVANVTGANVAHFRVATDGSLEFADCYGARSRTAWPGTRRRAARSASSAATGAPA